MHQRIILASGSEVRRRLLAAAGIAFTQQPAEIDEQGVADGHRGKTPRQLAGILAEAKAHAVSAVHAESFVIGADQTLELGGKLLFKPADKAEARRQLGALAGEVHRLHASFAVVSAGKTRARATRTVKLAMRPLSAGDIDWYLDAAGDAALSSVGGYQLEGLGIRLFDRIEGDYFTVLGLPMLPLLKALRKVGALER